MLSLYLQKQEEGSVEIFESECEENLLKISKPISSLETNEKNCFPFKISYETSRSHLIKTSTIKPASSQNKHFPLLPFFTTGLLYLFALPIDFFYEDLLKKIEKFWSCLKGVRIIKEKMSEIGKYSILLYFYEPNKAEDFFHV